tara:strand:+ start:374 stop:631 length:258 start_codon:yes stop_codon:yes gene_type:complete
MKKYTDYLEDIYQPISADELKQIDAVIQNPIERKMLDEIFYLRGLLAEAYMWIGRKATQSQINRRYTNLMREAARINTEKKEGGI